MHERKGAATPVDPMSSGWSWAMVNEHGAVFQSMWHGVIIGHSYNQLGIRSLFMALPPVLGSWSFSHRKLKQQRRNPWICLPSPVIHRVTPPPTPLGPGTHCFEQAGPGSRESLCNICHALPLIGTDEVKFTLWNFWQPSNKVNTIQGDTYCQGNLVSSRRVFFSTLCSH